MALADDEPGPARPIFPKLASGPGRMPPERVARHQKGRLQGAMIEAVARHGYAGTTMRELVTLAGVSKTTFYEHFDNKEDCFLSTFDEAVRQAAGLVGAAYARPERYPDKLREAIGAFLELAAERPDAASLVAVESLAVGVACVPHRERAAELFEGLLRRSFEGTPAGGAAPAMTARAIVAGIRSIVYHSLRNGRAAELPEQTLALTDWTLSYHRPESPAVDRAAAAAERPAPSRGEVAGALDWCEPPDSALSRSRLEPRERIVRGATRVVLEDGYQALSIPAISRAAGISNQTFYEHFESKRDAFLAAFDVVGGEAMEVTAAALASEAGRPESIGVAVRALLEFVAESEVFARLAFFELPTAGPEALDRADAMLGSFSALLGPGAAPAELGEPPPRAVLEVIPGGIWAVIQHEIVRDRTAELPALAPQLTRIALQPFGAVGLADE